MGSMIRLQAPLPPVSSTGDTQEDSENLLTGEGKEINRWESLGPYKSFNTLWRHLSIYQRNIFFPTNLPFNKVWKYYFFPKTSRQLTRRRDPDHPAATQPNPSNKLQNKTFKNMFSTIHRRNKVYTNVKGKNLPASQEENSRPSRNLPKWRSDMTEFRSGGDESDNIRRYSSYTHYY